MVRLIASILLTLIPSFLLAVEYTVSFTSKTVGKHIDSVWVTNLTNSKSIRLVGNEDLVLSGIIQDSPGGVGYGYTSIYPNPTMDKANFVLSMEKGEQMKLSLFDMSHKELAGIKKYLTPGNHHFMVELPRPGFYVLQLSGKDEVCGYKISNIGTQSLDPKIEYSGIDLKAGVLKVANPNSLFYKPGDVIQFSIYSGKNNTIVTDSPNSSKNYQVEFFDCIDPAQMSYPIVKIGTQWWMAKNLSWLPSVNPASEGSETNKHYYVYDYNGFNITAAKSTFNYKTYGVLYNWPAAMNNESASIKNPSDVKGVCPDGWHLPSDAEWKVMVDFLSANGYGFKGTAEDLAKSLSAGAQWLPYNDEGTPGKDLFLNNATGFSALPGGRRSSDGSFQLIGEYAPWWSTNQNNQAGGLWRLVAYSKTLYNSQNIKSDGFGVRCVKNEPVPRPDLSVSIPQINSWEAGTSGQVPITINRTESLLSEGSKVNVKLYLSVNADPLTGNILLWSSDSLNSEFSTNYLNINATVTINVNVSIPESTNAGSYYLWAIVDESNSIIESNETNNMASTNVNITPAQIIPADGFKDARDGRIYKWVKIGDQVWMAENLAYLPSVYPSSSGSSTAAQYYVFGYNGTDLQQAKSTANYSKYGTLYNWTASLTACPAGWHLPSDAEWEQLAIHISSVKGPYAKSDDDWYSIGRYLKGKAGWFDNGNGLDEFGFNALPGGFRSPQGAFNMVGGYGFWRSSGLLNEVNPLYRALTYNSDFFNRDNNAKDAGYSIRCVKDDISKLPDVGMKIPASGLVEAGKSTTIQMVVDKTGGNLTASNFVNVKIYFSPSPILGADKVLLWSSDDSKPDFAVSVLNSTGTISLTAPIIIPAQTMAGTYYIFAIADEGNAHLESNETNNKSVCILTVMAYSSIVSGYFTDHRDSRQYKWVKIGNQYWMAENLAYLPKVSSPYMGSATEKHYYVVDYNDTVVYKAKATADYMSYGTIYNWPAAVTACPDGWHLPTQLEWEELAEYVNAVKGPFIKDGFGNWSGIGTHLKSKSGWKYNGNGTDDFGFNGIPAGDRWPDGFWNEGNSGFWWTSTPRYTHSAEYRSLNQYSTFGTTSKYREHGLSVRCVKNDVNLVPKVYTNEVINITSTEALCIGNITSDGGSPISARGICWSSSGIPTVSDSHTTNGASLGEFAGRMTGLEPNSTYYVRAYATNVTGTGYGSLVMFNTKIAFDGIERGSLTDIRDGRTYKTVKLGDKWWMSENLAFLPSINGLGDESVTSPKYYVPGYYGTIIAEAKLNAQFIARGVLYNVPASKIACPSGWHVPTDAEWYALGKYVSDVKGPYESTSTHWSDVAKHLKAVTGWEPDPNGSDDFGFGAIPSGYRNGTVDADPHGNGVYFWSSSEIVYLKHSFWIFSPKTTGIGKGTFYEGNVGLTVRCVKD